MAEIKVEKREKTPIWPWIIGILLLIAVIWFLVDALGENGEREYQERQGEVEEVGDASLLRPETEIETAHSIHFLYA
jgi:hypothetical protein